MQVSRSRILLLASMAFIFGLGLMGGLLHRNGAFEPQPYWVEKVEWQRAEGNKIHIHVEFYKMGCEFELLVMRGVYLDVVDPRPIPFEDVDGEQGDREAGLHSADFLVGPLRQDYEAIEIRTRHICDDNTIDGRVVQRLLARVELK